MSDARLHHLSGRVLGACLLARLCPGLLVLVIGMLVPAPSLARRAPAPGGAVTVSVPPEFFGAVVEAHIYAPLLVPRIRGERDAPTVPGIDERFGSHILTGISVSADQKTWRFEAVAASVDVAASLIRCLQGKSERHGGHGSVEDALRAANVQTQVEADARGVTITLSRPVAVLPELFLWCPLRPATNAPTGPYALTAPGRLAWRSGNFDAPPLLGAIELQAAGGEVRERADVVINPLQSEGSGATLLSPWPDVVVLVQSPTTRDADPFALREGNSLRSALRADLIAAVWAGGRGGPTDALLPPGVAPARPLPEVVPAPAVPLSLMPVNDDAPRLPLSMHDDDPLTDAVAERLAVIVRSKGLVVDARRQSVGSDGAELVRWRPPTRDAAIALLAFVGEREQLMSDPGVRDAANDPRLLGEDAAERLAAALVLERALLDSRLVVPLLVVERVIGVDPDLRGVVIRGDGVPLLDGAWWGGGR